MKSKTKVIIGFALSVTSIIGLYYLLPQNDISQKREYTKVNIPQRQIIILDSVEAPLPPNAKNLQSMPEKREPQPLPNAELDKPIVITKMPIKKN
jgi:hypothetical protein